MNASIHMKMPTGHFQYFLCLSPVASSSVYLSFMMDHSLSWPCRKCTQIQVHVSSLWKLFFKKKENYIYLFLLHNVENAPQIQTTQGYKNSGKPLENPWEM